MSRLTPIAAGLALPAIVNGEAVPRVDGGAGPRRADKFHRLFDTLMETLASKAYEFVRVDRRLV